MRLLPSSWRLSLASFSETKSITLFSPAFLIMSTIFLHCPTIPQNAKSIPTLSLSLIIPLLSSPPPPHHHRPSMSLSYSPLPFFPSPNAFSRGSRGTYRAAAAASGSRSYKHAATGELATTTPRTRIDDHHDDDGKKTTKKREEEMDVDDLGVLYDDGYGTLSVKDYLDAAKEIIKPDGGPPRWFCPLECGPPLKDAPLLLFLPGVDGVGMGLMLHHRSLGKVYEVRCLHIPVYDQTPFEGLVKFVDQCVKCEHVASPNRPIYLVGDSFGGCLALSVAAHNPTLDLVLVLVNPATSFGKSQLQPILPLLEAIPSDLHVTVPYLLSFVMGDPVKMAMASVVDGLAPPETLNELSKSLTSLLPRLSDMADILPKEALLWKLKLLKAAASYANSRLHRVEAEVLVLASGKDNMLPSGEEADRLWTSLKNCRVRYFKDSGHTLLLEDGTNLLYIIKGTRMYRRSRQHDYIKDYLPPTISEFRKTFDEDSRWFRLATSPVLLSTLGNGKIVRGLVGIPDNGPILLVGYHMLMGLELGPLYEGFLREKKTILRGMAHPILFSTKHETSRQEVSRFDAMSVYGAVPVSPINMYRLFSRKSFVLLYPGGAREALHRKGEEYELFWPDQPEFVRMAARFGATIVPFGVVGEDDVAELVLDYNDQARIPFVRQWIEDMNQDAAKVRANMNGEVANQELYMPGLLPKLPGRFYYLFGKPFETRGRKDILMDRKSANDMYLQIKSEIQHIMAYLKRKREEDPYRSIITRTVYQTSWATMPQVPTFDP